MGIESLTGGRVKILVCIDDTDTIETMGTGKLSQILIDILQERDWGNCSAISRHQLFVHQDIPYTSHNSSMCFSMNFNGEIDELIHLGARFLETRSAKGSDPGLCVANLDNGIHQNELIDFGLLAKRAVLPKKAAYDLAKTTGVHLSEHGGTGDGVVGALAGIGLRLSGNDGRFRGWGRFGAAGTLTTVKALCSAPFIDAVTTLDGARLPPDTRIMLGADKVKTIMANNQQVVMVTPAIIQETLPQAFWRTLNKVEIKQY